MNWRDFRREHQQQFESLVLAYDSALIRANSPADASAEAESSTDLPDGEPLPEPVQARLRAAQVTLRLLEQARLKDLTARSVGPATPLWEALDPQSALELPTIAGR